jgi:hypothetical protein
MMLIGLSPAETRTTWNSSDDAPSGVSTGADVSGPPSPMRQAFCDFVSLVEDLTSEEVWEA